MADRADSDGMAATRLSDGQKGEIVTRFGNGESSQELAGAFGCSTATITRVVKAALSPEAYERLKAQRGRRGRGSAEPEPEAVPAARQTAELSREPAGADLPESLPEPPAAEPMPRRAAPPAPVPPAADADEPAPDRSSGRGSRRSAAEPEDAEDSPSVLAIDDADDFGGGDEEFGDEEIGEGDGPDFTPVPLVLNLANDSLVEPRPLVIGSLPASSAYMLVDKTVELQARPLSDLPELGRLPPGEEERQALVMFLNPRQAKRQCGRTQRVIKMPDLTLLQRTAPYLLAQGISRVVIEGSLYALPGS
ncbi:MAG: hypothetical protein VKO65_02195 [Cyanobacteriota bacterium]|nr:hypothetical protein [Cyanobacteriota bacterium]